MDDEEGWVTPTNYTQKMAESTQLISKQKNNNPFLTPFTVTKCNKNKTK